MSIGISETLQNIGGNMKLRKFFLFGVLFFLTGMLFGETQDHELILVSAKSHDDATIFEVTFAKPVKVPDDRVISQAGTTLRSYAPNGFYTFNLDIYIDTDRIKGSGKTSSLPGRNVQINPESAWEKIICLSPQPNYARLMLEQEMKQVALEKVAAQK